jgi:hypothetical protein
LIDVRLLRAGISVAVFFAAIAAAPPAQAPMLPALDFLEKGAWEIRMRGRGAPSYNLCLGDARQLIQLRHPDRSCRRFVIEDGPGEVTVHYVCPSAGYGRTTVRIETPRLVQVHTQGIAEGEPFLLQGEGRLKGACR